MPIMPDTWIRRMATEHGMIEPFVESQRREGVISFGLSSYGYDARAGRRVQDLHQRGQRGGRPEGVQRPGLRHRKGETCIIPPNSFVLTATRSNTSASRATCW
jgi:dCTP deaminase